MRVVEDHHPLAADDNQALFLEGIQPTHEDVGADPGGKLQVRNGHVRNTGVEEVAAHGVDVTGLFPGDAEDDGDVVGGERPQDVLFPADLSEGEAAGRDVLAAAMMTSSPGPTPSAARPICNAPVQLEVAMACLTLR